MASIRPDLDGNEIMKILGIGAGPEVGAAYRFLLDQRLEHGPQSPEVARAVLLTGGRPVAEWLGADQVLAGPLLPGGLRPDVHPLTLAAEEAEDLGWLAAGTAEPVRQPRLELGRLPRRPAPGPGRRGRAASGPTGRRATRSPRGPSGSGFDWLAGMTIFQACTPPGCRVSGRTVRPLTRRGFSRIRGSPTSGAPTRSSSGTRYAWASGSSSSRLGRRWPVSSRDSVLFEMPVARRQVGQGDPSLGRGSA